MQSNVFAVFQIADKTCALRTDEISELLPLPALARPPATPPILAGFLDLGGRAVPVIDLAILFGGKRHEPPQIYAHLILLKSRNGLAETALLVERVSDVTSSMQVPKDIADDKTLNGTFTGTIDVAGSPAYIIAPDRLLMEAERQQLENLTAAAQARLGEWQTAS